MSRDGVAGYPIDLRVKAEAPRWPPEGLMPLDGALYAVIAQWGLGAFEHYLETRDDQWLAAAVDVCEHLVTSQRTTGPLTGGFAHEFAFPHSFDLEPPWLSAMAQGEAASLLIRVHAETGDDRFAHSAALGIRPYALASSEGGVRTMLGDGPFYEEYPTDPPSLVLNGAIFALWGLRDVGVGLDDGHANALFEEGVDVLAANIDRWDLGYWSRYDLFPHRRVNIASFAYHQLHIDQLAMMERLAPRPQLGMAVERFRGYAASPMKRARAFAAKVAFRMSVPR